MYAGETDADADLLQAAAEAVNDRGELESEVCVEISAVAPPRSCNLA